MTKQAVCNLNF